MYKADVGTMRAAKKLNDNTRFCTFFNSSVKMPFCSFLKHNRNIKSTLAIYLLKKKNNDGLLPIFFLTGFKENKETYFFLFIFFYFFDLKRKHSDGCNIWLYQTSLVFKLQNNLNKSVGKTYNSGFYLQTAHKKVSLSHASLAHKIAQSWRPNSSKTTGYAAAAAAWWAVRILLCNCCRCCSPRAIKKRNKWGGGPLLKYFHKDEASSARWKLSFYREAPATFDLHARESFCLAAGGHPGRIFSSSCKSWPVRLGQTKWTNFQSLSCFWGKPLNKNLKFIIIFFIVPRHIGLKENHKIC